MCHTCSQFAPEQAFVASVCVCVCRALVFHALPAASLCQQEHLFCTFGLRVRDAHPAVGVPRLQLADGRDQGRLAKLLM
eukprot:556845-Pelagomonas_calceolata.AAC.1